MRKGNNDVNFLPEKRVVQLFYVFLILFLLLVIRLSVIQVLEGGYYAAKAVQRETSTVALEEFPRGQILDRHLRSLTQSIQSNRLVVFPQIITNTDLLAEELAAILKLDKNKLLPVLKKSPCILPYHLSPEQAKAVSQHNQPGVLVLPVSFRYGPLPLAAQVVGHLGKIHSYQEISSLSSRSKEVYRADDWVGRTGLELYYEHELRATGLQGYARLFMDAHTKWLRGLGMEVNTLHLDSGRQNLVTTIDADIQRIVERVMDARVKKGAVVVMDVWTGDILAMASRPTYNPQPREIEKYLKGDPEAFLDQCTMLFPPGSLFKVVVAAAALEEGIVSLEDTFHCRGERDRPVRCWSASGHGSITFAQAFAQSCNPVFVKVALELGAEKLIAYAQRFGFDNQKVIGYPVPCDLRQNLNLISAPHNLANSSVGQGPVLATPVQVTAMMNAVVNDGVYRQPRLVREVRTEGGVVTRFFPGERGSRVISSRLAGQLRQLLASVTAEGIGREAYLEDYGSAGKTGSAQADGTGERVNAWFCGYAPVDQPRYVITVLCREGISGGKTAAPVFKEIMGEILHSHIIKGKKKDMLA